MRKFPYKTWLWVGVFLLYPWVVYSAGLGKLTILSTLGQPLSAEIDLMSVQKDELASLTARIASPDAFQQAKIQYSPALIGVRLSIERRADGKAYIKIISTRPVNEPFLSVLVELSWAQGRLVREYTALIDPPSYAASAPAPVPIAPTVPPAAPETKPVAPPPPVVAAPLEPSPRAPAVRVPAGPRPAAAAKAGVADYAVKRGDTLAKIAASVKPEGVTLEQMLVSLYRDNTDAFAGNMNRLKTGKILRVPDKESVAETPQPAALKEVRVQAADWNAYRLKLAEAAGAAPAQESTKSAASGKITTAVDDKAAGKEAPKEVLKLSKGESPAPGKAGSGKPIAAKDRVRMLEEEAVAREKSLTEANDRVAQLEKNIKDMQRLLEIKGIAPAAKTAVTPAPTVTPEKAPPPAKAEPAKPEPAKALTEAPKGEQKAAPPEKPPVVEPPKAEAPKAEVPKAEVPKAEVPKAEQPAPPPKAKPKVAAPPPKPAPEPDLVDQIISAATDPVYLGGGLGALAVIGGVYWLARRRRGQDGGGDEKAERTAPAVGRGAATTAMAASPLVSPVVVGSDDVDPLAEADLYLNFGRDAQAEEVLIEALAKNPQHEEAQLKLLQIYAGRKDKTKFEKIARNLHLQTSGAGDGWIKAAGMGYAFEPENALYEAGKSAPAAAVPAAGGAISGTDLDFDLDLSPGAGNATTTDVSLDVSLDSAIAEKTMIMQPGELAGMSVAPDETVATQDITQDSAILIAKAFSGDGAVATPDFTLNVPAGSGNATAMVPDLIVDAPPENATKTDVTGDSAVPMVSVIDFNFDAKAAAPATRAGANQEFNDDSTMIISPENQAKATGLKMDFDIGSTASAEPAAPGVASSVVSPDPDFEFGGAAPAAPIVPDLKLDDISLSLDDAPKVDAAAPAGGAKDDHWYDVQTKFDLAKAYQEMGDKDGAREILQEVIKEGDAAQQVEAKQLLDTLG